MKQLIRNILLENVQSQKDIERFAEDILEYLEGTRNDKALIAWVEAKKAVQIAGYYNTVEFTNPIISNCIEAVYTEEESWAASDCTKKELIDFIETMNSSQFKKIEEFFETMPKLTHTFTVINPKTKKENTVTLEGLTSFFG
jgi:hypothetical protein